MISGANALEGGKPMISKGLMELIFSASSIERWNDHPRTSQFTEIDKQAHKAAIAYFIARAEEDRGRAVNWDRLIRNGMFSFLHRVLVTDIKPPIFYSLMADKKKQKQLNAWVYSTLEPLLSPLAGGDLCVQCREYLDSEPSSLEDRILGAAHYIATRWEFEFIYYWGKPLYGIEKTREEIMSQIEKYQDLSIVKDILSSKSNDGANVLISLVGQLRFQKRWAQVPRLPQTSVLGHLLVVALLSWLISLEIGVGVKRRRNNFYCGLFHDLPEVLTRDIISPVKRSVEGLDRLLKDLERKVMEENFLPHLPESWRDDMLYMVMNEFKNRYRKNGKVHTVKGDFPVDVSDEDDPVDGQIVEVCDKLSAFIEAHESIRTGVHPSHLEEATVHIFDQFGKSRVAGYDVNYLFASFK